MTPVRFTAQGNPVVDTGATTWSNTAGTIRRLNIDRTSATTISGSDIWPANTTQATTPAQDANRRGVGTDADGLPNCADPTNYILGVFRPTYDTIPPTPTTTPPNYTRSYSGFIPYRADTGTTVVAGNPLIPYTEGAEPGAVFCGCW
ncbi:hypothetical protein DO97_04445 [Neosynechococcus sphagnicola sy1]|uniref:Uncharacterized protein n=1 Tax=Neosynechococcus sphagnicola sy1 TaxID=1497020 RepID=A0A098TKX7_9CYAN|nr:hypothetical protein [Neosynechococcus sphagnicola]KGF72941.1 hypothetical protein DO97_04445 [Neosynechococcus sphagnicola sy1]